MRAWAGCLSGRAHALLEARNLDACVVGVGVGPHGRGGGDETRCSSCAYCGVRDSTWFKA